jgi:hypothetical protein
MYNWSIDKPKDKNVLPLDFIFNGSDPEEKTKFMLSSVYSLDRTHKNWLRYESVCREEFDHQIDFAHDISPKIDESNKYIYIDYPPIQAAKNYMKFHPNYDPTDLISFINKQHADAWQISKEVDNFMIIDGKKLYQPELDYDLYRSIVDFVGLTDCYKLAATVHSRWHWLHENTN